MSAVLELETLNDRQREAVIHPGGPLMILAGAGSGKTRVITYRIARLLEEGVPPWRILAVTFTNKAAREMRERIEALAGDTARDLWMGTFHSICARFLRVDGHYIGIESNFVIYDDGDQMSTIRDIIKQKELDEKAFTPRAVLAEISRAKEKMLTPAKYRERANNFFERIVADLYPLYSQRLANANALDFDDLLVKAVQLLENSEVVREKYQERFLHVLIDEYQDVNYAQYQLANLLSEKHRNFTIVGDDDQSIYAWRGADVSLMLRFSSDHPDAKVVTLDQNYRSTQQILKAAHQVIRHNKDRSEKQLWTDNPAGSPISLSEAGTENDEAMLIVDTIVKEVRRGRRRFGEFAVLYRTNAQSRALEEAMLTMRVPHVLIGGQRFYERKEIKDMVAYLRLVFNPNDDAAFRRVINEPKRGLGNTALAKIADFAQAHSLPLFVALQQSAFQQEVTGKARKAMEQFADLIERARQRFEGKEISATVQMLLIESGMLEALRSERTTEAEGRLENLQELINVAAEHEAQDPEAHLGTFLEQIALVSDADSLAEEGEAVTLMTLHTSKGLEFPVVFLCGLEEGVFPHSRSQGDEKQLSEERRLCYVGMTRAREELHLTYATRRALYGQPSFNSRSRFIDDLAGMQLICLNSDRPPQARLVSQGLRKTREETYEAVDWIEDDVEFTEAAVEPLWKPPFQIGDRVTHRKFGVGVVVAMNPLKDDAEVTVAFPGEVGMKKMVQGIAKLEKAP